MLSSIQKIGVFKFKFAKSNIECMKKCIPGEYINNCSTTRLLGTMQNGAEVQEAEDTEDARLAAASAEAARLQQEADAEAARCGKKKSDGVTVFS